MLDDATLAIPERKGNRLVMGLRNLPENPAIGLLFLIPGDARDAARRAIDEDDRTNL